MIPSSRQQYHSWLLYLFLILFLHTTATGIVRRTITIANECSEPIWSVVADIDKPERYEVKRIPIGKSVALERQNGWQGQVWAKTGCRNYSSGEFACVTGNDNYRSTASDTTSIMILLRSTVSSPDFYVVTLKKGYNLPVVVKPINGSGPGCGAAGCVDDLNKSCPAELRTAGGAACREPCSDFNTDEYCCPYPHPDQACGHKNYSEVFKRACPRAFAYRGDDPNAFYCDGAAAQYLITFCDPSFGSLLGTPCFGIDDQGMPLLSLPVSPAYPPTSFSTNPKTRRGKIQAKEMITIVSVSMSGFIIVSITACIFLKRRLCSQNGRSKRKCKRDVENLLLQHGSLAPKRYRYLEIKKMTESLSEKLGQGGFGSVYKGTLPDGRLVAVKILSEIMDSNGEEFINEVASISRTSHVNIVSLLGFCYEGSKSALVYEFMPNKSLHEFLRHGSMDLKKLYEIAVGIAKGLDYLHTGCATRIVHFDIKPQNILLDDDLCPKISDFGLAKFCKKRQSVLSMLGTRGTAGYIAPEVFSRNFGAVSHKSDVYSYGMMLLEMAGAKRNVVIIEEIQSTSENYFPDKIYESMMIEEEGEEQEEGKRKMMLIGFWCIQTIPSERPSMSKVVEMLEGSIECIQIPPKPYLFSTAIPHHQQTCSSTSSFSPIVDMDNLAQD